MIMENKVAIITQSYKNDLESVSFYVKVWISLHQI